MNDQMVDLEEKVPDEKNKDIMSCPFCGNTPVERGGKLRKEYIVSHEETCFFRRFEPHTKFTDFDVSIWNRRD